jgi:hypothetical protein
MIYAAIEQLIPVGVAGALLTVVLVRFAPETLWMLLGFGRSCSARGVRILSTLAKGVVRGRRLVSRVGSPLSGVAANGEFWSPWAMGVPFGVGQLIMAGILYRTLGGRDGED